MKRVLAVDDSVMMRELVSATLLSAGYEVDTAEDGNRAYDVAQGKQFDLVLSDVNMPSMDGIGLVARLRACPAYRLVPIVMLTTESSAEMKARARSAGATGWIVKPFDPERLLNAVARVLS
jgi:two-component system chemotaxis response regulator CheY